MSCHDLLVDTGAWLKFDGKDVLSVNLNKRCYVLKGDIHLFQETLREVSVYYKIRGAVCVI
jgi:hypothetical protein